LSGQVPAPTTSTPDKTAPGSHYTGDQQTFSLVISFGIIGFLEKLAHDFFEDIVCHLLTRQ